MRNLFRRRPRTIRIKLSVVGMDIVRALLGAYAVEINELRERRDGLLAANNREVERRRALESAGRALYFAGRWSCENSDVDAAQLWTNLRDALQIEPGTATALGIGQRPLGETE